MAVASTVLAAVEGVVVIVGGGCVVGDGDEWRMNRKMKKRLSRRHKKMNKE